MTNHTTKDAILAKRDIFNEDEFEVLRNIVGSIVLSWAQMEGSLTMLSHIVFSMAGANGVSKDAPYECGRKVRYLVTALGRNDCFRTCAQDGIRLLRRVSALKRIRDPITHGFICAFDRAGRTIAFQRQEMKDGERRETYNRFNIDTLLGAAKESRSLALDMAMFVNRFAEMLPSEDEI